MELRARVVAAYESGLTAEEVAERFSVGVASVGRWARLLRERGAVDPRPPSPGGAPRVTAQELARALQQLPDATSKELAALVNRGRRGRERVHVSSIKRALRRNGFVVKKNGFVRRNSSGRT